jgi:membrane-bound lytic murein transglycosylase
MFPDIPKKEFRVFTPTGNGNEKLPMTVGSISDITIDHVVPIDQTLKRLGDENQLTQLELITKLYKNLSITQDEIEKNPYINCSDVNEIKKQKKNDKKEAKKNAIEKYKQSLKKLETELNLIKNDSPLRLMDSRYNSQKSNGKTYNKILHSNNNYYGIMIENEIIDDGNNTVTLYQILTDDVIDQSRQNGQLRVTKDPLEGESVRGREPLEEIINRI